ncbi:MAG: PEP-CTERM sorting domain-containing protein [Gammaproteobacteria bacterium]|nr:PEP-CTERM sorting domain-containing protein [Gammaproteobacteria bacterium]
MNFRMLFFIFYGVILSFPNVAMSTVVGSGNMSLQLPSGGTVYSRYNYTNRQYAQLSDSNLSDVTAYLDPNYSNVTSNGSSTVSGSYDSSSATQSFSFEANSSVPSSSNMGTVSVDLFASTFYTGTLSSFSYAYDFLGTKDTVSDLLWLTIQMEIAYLDSNNNWVNVYSDYTPHDYAPGLDGSQIWRTKMVRLRDQTNTGINTSGIVDFGDFSSYGVQRWALRYDFMGGGRDTEGEDQNPASIPEPATIALMSLGLVGIGYRRKKAI